MSKRYSLYSNANLRKGGRTICKMSDTQFGEKAKKFILDTCKDVSWIKENLEKTDNVKRIIQYIPSAIREIIFSDCKWHTEKAKTTIGKDFKGISPDWENHDIVGGLRSVKGAPYVIMDIGGDWESPLCVMVYHDGSQFRCYIPEKGNAYRKDLKICFGNWDAHYDSNTETYTDEIKVHGKTTLSDDLYIFNELCKAGVLDKEKDKEKMRGLGRDIRYDINMCIEDFSERVDVKSLKECKTYNNNKALYEKIMLNISKTIKKQIFN